MKRALVLSWAAVLCSACGLFHGAPSDEGAAGRASDEAGRSEDSGAGSVGANAGTTPAAGGGGGGSGAKGAGAGAELEQVWLGELWSQNQTAFCDPEDPQRSSTVVDPNGFTWRVLLKLDVRNPEDVRGEIRFGEGVPRIPERPDADLTTDNPPGSRSFWFCSFQVPIEGFSYRILAGRLSSDGVDFDFSANQIWDHWCATEKPACQDDSSAICDQRLPTCVCDEGECHADLRGNIRIQLSRTADSLEGHIPILGGHAGTPADIRLRRVK
jgi:hypothetical protein